MWAWLVLRWQALRRARQWLDQIAELNDEVDTARVESDILRGENEQLREQLQSTVRLAVIRLDALELTSRLRGTVDPNIRVEHEGAQYVIWGTRHLNTAQMNRMMAELRLLVDLT